MNETSEAPDDLEPASKESSQEEEAERHREAMNKVVPRARLDALRMRFTHVEFNVLELNDTSWADDAHLVFTSHLAGRSDSGFNAHVQYLIRYLADEDLDQAEELPEYDPEDPPAVELTATYEVQYSLADPEEVPDEDLEHFCSMNPIHNTWSFWREYVYNVTGRMGVEPVLVPLLPVPVAPNPSLEG
tara:strand:+ start:483 stop:1046 length:564 start_codon:yes stop_codon:yes gene_type:complete